MKYVVLIDWPWKTQVDVHGPFSTLNAAEQYKQELIDFQVENNRPLGMFEFTVRPIFVPRGRFGRYLKRLHAGRV